MPVKHSEVVLVVSYFVATFVIGFAAGTQFVIAQSHTGIVTRVLSLVFGE